MMTVILGIVFMSDTCMSQFPTLMDQAMYGNVEAQHNLALSFYQDRNYVMSAQAVAQSAAAGYPPSMFMLGIYYYNGIGVNKDIGKAIYWINAAANMRHGGAQCIMGYFNDIGILGRVDKNAAAMWYQMAINNGVDLRKAINDFNAMTMIRSTPMYY